MSLTPEVSRKNGLGVTPSPAPFFTPRPERRRPDSHIGRLDRDKEVNVQVLLRCRPLSDEEQKSNVPRVISCNEIKKEVNVLHNVANKQVDRVFTFDKIFGPKAQQRSIYEQAIAPIVYEVLDGFSCTVFAYGQTGTGKTYTMEGGMRKKGGDLPAEAGVIPRAVRHIFDTLEGQNADYSMKVTFLELYNEEITDLLASDEILRGSEDKQKKSISLMEDGKGSVVVRGLEEEVVYSANDIYALLERGSAKRRTADTLLNKRSSRSHSVFTITVHIKEEGVTDEELIKCGKLNLVDLAGSENISRSGSRDGRVREAGEINKSLLTLGRVINALVEHSSHIPYRDSKLTRLLRDSLGGKTKTCIIATISPSVHSLEETLSTLDYAHRAKNIKNKPEANQKFSKTILLRDLYMEMERMKEDVRAARDRNGVYVPQERFMREEAEKKARIERIEQLENDLDLREKDVGKFRGLYLTEQEKLLDVESELMHCKESLAKRNKELLNLEEDYKQAMLKLKEREIIISKMKSSENHLIDHAKGLCSDLQHASNDITSLFTRLDQKDKIESENHNKLMKFGSNLDQGLKDLHKTVIGSILEQQQHLRNMEEHSRSCLAHKHDVTRVMESRIEKTKDAYSSGAKTLKEVAETLRDKASSDMEKTYSIVASQILTVEQLLTASAMEAADVTQDILNSLNVQTELVSLAAKQQEQGLIQTMRSAQEISRATAIFVNNIYNKAHDIMESAKENQEEKSRKLAAFEMRFREEAEKEEKRALQDIADILSNLTAKKTTMVTEASREIQERDIKEKKKLEEEMRNMQKMSVNTKNDLYDYVKKSENHFIGNTISAAESVAVIENYLHHCSGKIDESRKIWENTRFGVKNLHAKGLYELNITKTIISDANKKLHDEFTSAFSSMDANFVHNTDDFHAAINEALMEDQENKKANDVMIETCLNQIVLLQENHGQSVSNIRNLAEISLVKDYMVDHDKNATPKKRVLFVPSLTSIEEMRSLFPKKGEEDSDVLENIQAKRAQDGSNRTPFLEVN